MAAVHKWRGERPTDALVNQLRRSRAINQENIVALQELIRLQTAVIEMALERVHGDSVTEIRKVSIQAGDVLTAAAKNNKLRGT